MLVITRQENERFSIGDDVVITVVRIDGNTVRLGVEAPRDVLVLREEVALKQGLGFPPGKRRPPSDA